MKTQSSLLCVPTFAVGGTVVKIKSLACRSSVKSFRVPPGTPSGQIIPFSAIITEESSRDIKTHDNNNKHTFLKSKSKKHARKKCNADFASTKNNVSIIEVEVPPGSKPGEELLVQTCGQEFMLTIPQGAKQGSLLQFQFDQQQNPDSMRSSNTYLSEQSSIQGCNSVKLKTVSCGGRTFVLSSAPHELNDMRAAFVLGPNDDYWFPRGVKKCDVSLLFYTGCMRYCLLLFAEFSVKYSNE